MLRWDRLTFRDRVKTLFISYQGTPTNSHGIHRGSALDVFDYRHPTKLRGELLERTHNFAGQLIREKTIHCKGIKTDKN